VIDSTPHRAVALAGVEGFIVDESIEFRIDGVPDPNFLRVGIDNLASFIVRE
jgi:hypothetical protein